jgi:Ni/Fe-hydrogenase subunit HybB-like protein
MLALGWRGNREQWRRLERAIAVMAVFIIPVAISVHTIISWILATTLQPGWHSTIFGPYFVVGAIFSGIGALFLAMTAVRRVFRLEDYIKLRQYRSLGLLFIVMNMTWAYFTYAENLAPAAGQQSDEFPVLASKLWGSFSAGFWVMVLLMIGAFLILVLPRLIPASFQRDTAAPRRYALGSAAAFLAAGFLLSDGQNALLSGAAATVPDVRVLGWSLVLFGVLAALLAVAVWLKRRLVTASAIAGALVLVGMWLERWNLIVPTVTHPRLVPYSTYTPTLTEVSLTAASVALFMLLFVLFFKLFPAVSIWEVAEGRIVEDAHKRISIPTPEPSVTRQRRRPWSLR